jgi:hypothetical protein
MIYRLGYKSMHASFFSLLPNETSDDNLFRTPANAPLSTRSTQIQALLDVVHLLPHPTSPCGEAPLHPPVVIPTSIIVPGITRLLDGLEEVQHRRLVYTLLSVFIEHHVGDDRPEQIIELAVRGMEEDNRGLRIQAG